MNDTWAERQRRRREALALRIPVSFGVLLDFTTGHIYEGEADDIQEEFERHLAPSHKPEIRRKMDSPGDLNESVEVDVLVVDYGGLHGGYGNAVNRYGTAVAKWAEEHPGRLVVLWTPFTSTLYRATFEDEFGAKRSIHLFDWDEVSEDGKCWRCNRTAEEHVSTDSQTGNILYRYGVGTSAFDNDENADFWKLVKAWIGVEATEKAPQKAAWAKTEA